MDLHRAPELDDDPEYTPDGQIIYSNPSSQLGQRAPDRLPAANHQWRRPWGRRRCEEARMA